MIGFIADKEKCYNCNKMCKIFYASADENLCEPCTIILNKPYIQCVMYTYCMCCRIASNIIDLKKQPLFVNENISVICKTYKIKGTYQLFPPAYNGIKILNYDWYIHAFGGLNAPKLTKLIIKFTFELNKIFDRWMFNQKTFYNNRWRFKSLSYGVNITYYIPSTVTPVYFNPQDVAKDILSLLLIFPYYKTPRPIRMLMVTALML